MIEEFKRGEVRQADFLSWIREEIEEMENKSVSKKAQIKFLENKYDVKINYSSYKKWVYSNIRKEEKTESKKPQKNTSKKEEIKDKKVQEVEDALSHLLYDEK